jgi:hypothetical protein
MRCALLRRRELPVEAHRSRLAHADAGAALAPPDHDSGDRERGRRYWGAVWPVTRENFVSLLYKLHYTMHIPGFWGRPVGH